MLSALFYKALHHHKFVLRHRGVDKHGDHNLKLLSSFLEPLAHVTHEPNATHRSRPNLDGSTRERYVATAAQVEGQHVAYSKAKPSSWHAWVAC